MGIKEAVMALPQGLEPHPPDPNSGVLPIKLRENGSRGWNRTEHSLIQSQFAYH